MTLTEALLWLVAALFAVAGVLEIVRRREPVVIGALLIAVGLLIAPGIGGLFS